MTLGGIMEIFKPTMYKKSIFDIDYQKLKNMGITCIVFDLDNTLGLIDEEKCPVKVKKLLKQLKKDFKIFVSSNNTKKRIEPYIKELEIEGFALALKPMAKNLRKIKKKYNFSKGEMVMIGDQIMTDILSGNRFKIMTILVDPLGKKDLKVTYFNRIFEQKIVDSYQKRGIFERGKYYE